MTTREDIALFIRNAARHDQGNPPTTRHRAAATLLAVAIAGALLPHDGLNLFFSSCAGAAGILWFHLWWKAARPLTLKSGRLAVIVALLGLQLAGCSALMFDDRPYVDPLLIFTDPTEFKTGMAYSIRIFGFEADPATVQKAMAQGGILKLHASDTARAYGVISLTRVVVYGT